LLQQQQPKHSSIFFPFFQTACWEFGNSFHLLHSGCAHFSLSKFAKDIIFQSPQNSGLRKEKEEEEKEEEEEGFSCLCFSLGLLIVLVAVLAALCLCLCLCLCLSLSVSVCLSFL
jgi:hypothetical protein